MPNYRPTRLNDSGNFFRPLTKNRRFFNILIFYLNSRGFISSTIMFNWFFLCIMLLAIKHTHFIPVSGVFLCIRLFLISFCPPIVFFDNPPCPTSLNIVRYPSLWQPPLTVPRQKRPPPFHYDEVHLSSTFLLSPQSCPTNLRIPLPLPYTAASPSR